MNAVVNDELVHIPEYVRDLASFRRWTRSDEFPEQGRYSHLKGQLWIDLIPEKLFSHNQVKGEFAIVLGLLVKELGAGRYFHDRTLLTNVAAGLSTEPDGTFVSFDSLQKRRVVLVNGGDDFMELEGTPDMVLEVVSKNSVRKDTRVLRELYWLAGIPEYWLVDARQPQPRLDILKRGREGYTAVRKQAGWIKSAVFDRSFQLTTGNDKLGHPEYRLAVR
jgi:Uma2 family endonuclease